MKQLVIQYIKRYKIQLGLLLFFLIWMLFFDEYNWLRMRNDKQKLDALKTEKAYLFQKIEEDRAQLKTLQTDTQELERFAREKYLLKQKNEEVFIIIEEE